MDSQAVYAWYAGLGSRGIKPGLGNITELLARLGDPQNRFRTVHVAGSDGKGSTCAFIESILRESGAKTGMFSSPHIEDMREMISVGGHVIPEKDLVILAHEIISVVEGMSDEGMECTFFETMTATAFMYFERMHVEYAVIEVGMGGKEDSTNVIVPEVSVITNISLEHTAFLGKTLPEIAAQKAGIIKRRVPVVTSSKGKALDTVRRRASDMDSRITVVRPAEIISLTPEGSVVDYFGERYELGIPGSYQAENMALAVEAVMSLKDADRFAPFIAAGLKNASLHARMQKLPGYPIVIDVTHTKAGMEALCRDIAQIYGRVTAVFGVLSDKDIIGMAQLLAHVADRVVVAAPDSERAMDPAEVFRAVSLCSEDVRLAGSVSEAIETALKISDGSVILVTGSFRMAEGALRWLKTRSA